MPKIVIAIGNIHYLLFKCRDSTRSKPRKLNTNQSLCMPYILYLLKTFSHDFRRQTEKQKAIYAQIK